MKLQSITALVKMELKKMIRQPANLFLSILFPAVLTLTFVFAFSDPELGMDIQVMIPGVIAYACIFLIMTVSQSFSTERQLGLLKRMNTTLMTPGEFMGSHVLTNMIIAFVQVIVVFTISVLMGFRPQSGLSSVFAAFPVIVLFSLSSVGLGLITATVSKTPEAATGVSFIFILPQMFFGTFVPVTTTTRQIAIFIPSYYVVDALTLVFAGDWMNPHLLIDVSVISIFSIVIVALGIVLFRKYGKS